MDKTIAIYNWSQLQKFGISALTSEACVYGLRILCDLSQEGEALVKEFMGADISFDAPMNSFVGDEPSTANVLLSRGVFKDLVTFACWRAGAVALLEHDDGSLVALFDEALVRKYQAAGFAFTLRPRSAGPAIGSRNIHAMSAATFAYPN